MTRTPEITVETCKWGIDGELQQLINKVSLAKILYGNFSIFLPMDKLHKFFPFFLSRFIF